MALNSFLLIRTVFRSVVGFWCLCVHKVTTIQWCDEASLCLDCSIPQLDLSINNSPGAVTTAKPEKMSISILTQSTPERNWKSIFFLTCRGCLMAVLCFVKEFRPMGSAHLAVTLAKVVDYH